MDPRETGYNNRVPCSTPDPETGEVAPAPPPPPTIEDARRFFADEPDFAMEPDEWMLVGAPTNFYASAPVDVESGTLLGEPAEVRFTATAYHWRYGDGTSETSDGPGASWAALGQEEFTETATSHVYAARGRYRAGLVVDYASEYRIAGGDWQPIDGVVSVASGRVVDGRAVRGTTVLVGGDCRAHPSGPGC